MIFNHDLFEVGIPVFRPLVHPNMIWSRFSFSNSFGFHQDYKPVFSKRIDQAQQELELFVGS